MSTRSFKRSAVGLFAAVFAGVLLAQPAAGAPDKDNLGLDKIPKKVMDSLKAKFPKAQIHKWTKEKEGETVVYDIEFKQDGRKFEADIKEDGTIHNWEIEIAARRLPKPVQKAVETKYPKSTLKEIMAITAVKDGKDALEGLEIVLETAGKKEVEVTVAPDGKILEDSGEKAWTTLFNGKDLDGWKFHLGKEGAGNEGTFSAKDGILICSGKPSGYIYTTKSYSNFTLEFEFAFKKPDGLKSDSEFRGNSGCLIHVGEKNALGVWPRSIEVQGANRQLGVILPIPRDVKCTTTFDATASEKARKPVGEFNKVEIDVKGGDMTIKLNGAVVSTVGACELTEGPIGLQSEGAETHWKNIRIRQR